MVELLLGPRREMAKVVGCNIARPMTKPLKWIKTAYRKSSEFLARIQLNTNMFSVLEITASAKA
ncbi:hypothetical protein D3C84_1172950 [compost metagenome]